MQVACGFIHCSVVADVDFTTRLIRFLVFSMHGSYLSCRFFDVSFSFDIQHIILVVSSGNLRLELICNKHVHVW